MSQRNVVSVLLLGLMLGGIPWGMIFTPTQCNGEPLGLFIQFTGLGMVVAATLISFGEQS